MRKINSLTTCALIALVFFWTGSGYLTWLYNLIDNCPSVNSELYSEVIGYLFQAMGILMFSFSGKSLKSRRQFTGIIVLDYVFIAIAGLCTSSAVTLVAGYIMNTLHGMVAGLYLFWLTAYVPQQSKGKVFGFGYGIGSIASWLLSLVGGGNFLASNSVFIAYAIFAAASVLLVLTTEDNIEEKTEGTFQIDKKLIIIASCAVVLLSAVKSAGFYFPMASLADGSFSLEFTRAFYAIGLIAAGIINDRSRRWGAVCCLAALVFPFIILLVTDTYTTSVFWILGYVFFGFFAVYRVILFSDLYEKSTFAIILAPMGLMFGRIGDAAGAAGGILFEGNNIILVIISSLLFMITIIVFFGLYNRLYITMISPEESVQLKMERFSDRFDFSPREKDVFMLITQGRSNAEIAGDLFISENTVKFHMKNILKKTNCSNRTEVMAIYKRNN